MGEVQSPSSIQDYGGKNKKTKRTAKVRGHPHTRPARQLRQGVEPRLTYRIKIRLYTIWKRLYTIRKKR